MHGVINVESPKNTSKWQMGFNSAFKGLNKFSDRNNKQQFLFCDIFFFPGNNFDIKIFDSPPVKRNVMLFYFSLFFNCPDVKFTTVSSVFKIRNLFQTCSVRGKQKYNDLSPDRNY
jgi:hypothetical protein